MAARVVVTMVPVLSKVLPLFVVALWGGQAVIAQSIPAQMIVAMVSVVVLLKVVFAILGGQVVIALLLRPLPLHQLLLQ